MTALKRLIEERTKLAKQQPKKWKPEQVAAGDGKAAHRLVDQLQAWQREYTSYCSYAAHLRALLALNPDPTHPFRENIRALVPELSLGDEKRQLVILTDAFGRILVRPVADLRQSQQGAVSWSAQSWAPGFPLHVFEDAELQLPAGTDRAAWLSGWHTEREWLNAIHHCKYSNAVIGITEELSPVADNLPGQPGINSILLRFDRTVGECHPFCSLGGFLTAVISESPIPGPDKRGVWIPSQAIVRFQGATWVCVEAKSGTFGRRMATVEQAAKVGWLVTSGFPVSN